MNFVISSTVGTAWSAVDVDAPDVSCGRSNVYAVFDDASKSVAFVSFQVSCTSPASDCSSRRPPFGFHQSRPVAPDMSAEPAWPTSAPEGKSLFVKVIRAVTPSGFAAASESCAACASGFAGGVAPPPPWAATATTAPPTSTMHAATASVIRRVVERVRRIFTVDLSGCSRRPLCPRSLKLS